LRGDEGLVALRNAVQGQTDDALPADVLAEIAQTIQPCVACLDEGRETPATAEHNGFMYCDAHRPTRVELDRGAIIGQFSTEIKRLWGSNCKISIVPPGYTIDDRVRELDAAYWSGKIGGLTRAQWQALPKGETWQSMLNGEYTEVANLEDYWAKTEAKLEASGYTALFKADEQALLHRVDVPRIYAEPHPKFDLVEVDGVKRVVQVGIWQSADVEQEGA
jgi:hypothetical protein